VSIPGLGV